MQHVHLSFTGAEDTFVFLVPGMVPALVMEDIQKYLSINA